MKSGDEILYDYAMEFVGLPYRWGGDDTIDGFDCSGLVQELLAVVGMDPPGDQTAQGLYEYFQLYGSATIAEFGALCFYGKSHNEITHVGMALNEELMIEAGGGGSNTTSPSAASAHNAYIRIRPINHRKDLVSIIMPTYNWNI